MHTTYEVPPEDKRRARVFAFGVNLFAFVVVAVAATSKPKGVEEVSPPLVNLVAELPAVSAPPAPAKKATPAPLAKAAPKQAPKPVKSAEPKKSPPEPVKAEKAVPKPATPDIPLEQIEKQFAEKEAREKQAAELLGKQREAEERARREDEILRRGAEGRARDVMAAQGDAGFDYGPYIREIQEKVRREMKEPPGLAGKPRAIFLVTLDEKGFATHIILRQSSGIEAYDEAAREAIKHASPLLNPSWGPDVVKRLQNLRLPIFPK
jgi:outer membrane biosynthesis protein TonB